MQTWQVLGMELIDSMDGGDFTLYFLAYESEEDKALTAEQKAKTKFNRQGAHEHGSFPFYGSDVIGHQAFLS